MRRVIHSIPQDGPPDTASSGLFMTLDAELARKLLEAAPTILYVHDVQNERNVFQNRSVGELLGYPSAEGKQPGEWTAFVHPDDLKRFPDHCARLRRIRTGETLSWEFRMRDVDGRWRWFLRRDSLLSCDDSGAPLLIVGSSSDITEQKLAEQHKELLADEMRHRARNLVSIVQAIARMSRPRNQPEANKYIDTFMGRLLTLLNTGGIVLSSASRTADLETVVKTTLAPFESESTPRRIHLIGPSVSLSERTAGGLALAIHELATNALKYGALSVEAGIVTLTWSLAGHSGRRHFTLEWKESGGPSVSLPTTEGFGGLVIRQSVAHETDGLVTLNYLSDGLYCRLEFGIAET